MADHHIVDKEIVPTTSEGYRDAVPGDEIHENAGNCVIAPDNCKVERPHTFTDWYPMAIVWDYAKTVARGIFAIEKI